MAEGIRFMAGGLAYVSFLILELPEGLQAFEIVIVLLSKGCERGFILQVLPFLLDLTQYFSLQHIRVLGLELGAPLLAKPAERAQRVLWSLRGRMHVVQSLLVVV